MATRKWRGDSPATAKVQTVQLTAYDAVTTYKITINGKTVSTVGTGGTTTTTATALLALLQASTIPEFTKATWSASTSTITATATNPGVPFVFTKSVSGGTGTMGSITTVTAGTGPNDVSVAANWTGATLPTTGDTVVFENNAVNALYGLDAFAGVVFAAKYIRSTYTGEMGLAEFNADGYQEYLPTYWQDAATTTTVGDGTGAGSGRIKLDSGSTVTTLNIHGSGNPLEAGVAAICWKGTHASNTVNITKGSLDVAYFAGETATISELRIGSISNIQNDANVRLGSGVTLTTIDKTGGTLELNSAVTTLNVTDGVATVLSGAITSLNLTGGTVYQNGNGAMTAIMALGGTLDFTRGVGTIDVTDASFYGDSTVRDRDARVNWINPFNVLGSKVSVDFGDELTIDLS